MKDEKIINLNKYFKYKSSNYINELFNSNNNFEDILLKGIIEATLKLAPAYIIIKQLENKALDNIKNNKAYHLQLQKIIFLMNSIWNISENIIDNELDKTP